MPQLLQTVTTPGTPVQIVSKTTTAQYLVIIACKGMAGPTVAANTGKVRVGFSSTGGQNALELTPGSTQAMFTNAGSMDLSHWYVDAVTAGDGVVFFFI